MKLCHRSCIWLESEGWRLYSRPRAQFFPIWTNLDWERLVFSLWFDFFLPLPDWCGDDSQPRLMGFESTISQSHLRSLIATHWDASGKAEGILIRFHWNKTTVIAAANWNTEKNHKEPIEWKQTNFLLHWTVWVTKLLMVLPFSCDWFGHLGKFLDQSKRKLKQNQMLSLITSVTRFELSCFSCLQCSP